MIDPPKKSLYNLRKAIRITLGKVKSILAFFFMFALLFSTMVILGWFPSSFNYGEIIVLDTNSNLHVAPSIHQVINYGRPTL